MVLFALTEAVSAAMAKKDLSLPLAGLLRNLRFHPVLQPQLGSEDPVPWLATRIPNDLQALVVDVCSLTSALVLTRKHGAAPMLPSALTHPVQAAVRLVAHPAPDTTYDLLEVATVCRAWVQARMQCLTHVSIPAPVSDTDTDTASVPPVEPPVVSLACLATHHMLLTAVVRGLVAGPQVLDAQAVFGDVFVMDVLVPFLVLACLDCLCMTNVHGWSCSPDTTGLVLQAARVTLILLHSERDAGRAQEQAQALMAASMALSCLAHMCAAVDTTVACYAWSVAVHVETVQEADADIARMSEHASARAICMANALRALVLGAPATDPYVRIVLATLDTVHLSTHDAPMNDPFVCTSVVVQFVADFLYMRVHDGTPWSTDMSSAVSSALAVRGVLCMLAA